MGRSVREMSLLGARVENFRNEMHGWLCRERLLGYGKVLRSGTARWQRHTQLYRRIPLRKHVLVKEKKLKNMVKRIFVHRGR